MNERLQAFARAEILKDLEQCTEGQQLVFVNMYGPAGMITSLKDVVDGMRPDSLDWAMTQVRNSVLKNEGVRK